MRFELCSNPSRAVRKRRRRASERAREFVRRHGGSPGEANRAAESAFERRLPISLYERMSAECSRRRTRQSWSRVRARDFIYLTIRRDDGDDVRVAESVAAEQIAKNAANEEQDTVEQAPESWDETATKHLRPCGRVRKQARRGRRDDARVIRTQSKNIANLLREKHIDIHAAPLVRIIASAESRIPRGPRPVAASGRNSLFQNMFFQKTKPLELASHSNDAPPSRARVRAVEETHRERRTDDARARFPIDQSRRQRAARR